MSEPVDPTPGPWRAVEMGEDPATLAPRFVRIVGPEGERICDVILHPSAKGPGVEVGRANARHIARNGPSSRSTGGQT